MRIVSRLIRPLALATVSALALAGCGTGSSGTSAGGSNGPITHWSMWKEGEPQQKVIAGAISDFEAETGIQVKVQWQGRSNTDKLVAALNTNNVPDIVDQTFAKLATVLGDPGQAKSLGDAYAADVEGSKVSALVPAKYSSLENIQNKDGQPWLIPYSLITDGIWFNAAKHPELVTAPPKDWAGFLALLDKIKSSGVAPIAADGDIAGYNSMWFTTLMNRAGGTGSFRKLVSDRTGASWDDPAVLRVAQDVEQLVRGGYLIKGYDASKFPAQQQAWGAGKADLILNGSWIPAETKSYSAAGFQYGSFPLPGESAKAPLARTDFTGFAVPAKSKNAQAAQKLATYLLRKKYQDAFGSQATVLPVRSDAAVPDALKKAKESLDSASGIYLQNDGVTYPGYIEKVFGPLDDQLFLGKISSQEFVSQMKTAQIQYWKDKG